MKIIKRILKCFVLRMYIEKAILIFRNLNFGLKFYFIVKKGQF